MSTEHQKLIFCDVEPAGSDPRRHPIIQLAAVATDDRLYELDSFEVKVRFAEATATKWSLRKAAYSRAKWYREAVEPSYAARKFVAFLQKHSTMPVMRQNGAIGMVAQLVAHNAAFDSAFLQAWFDKLSIYCPARFQFLCTLQRAEWHFTEHPTLPRPDNMKLLTLCRYFNVPLHKLEAHDALADVRATIGLYQAIREAQTDSSAARPQYRSWRSRRA